MAFKSSAACLRWLGVIPRPVLLNIVPPTLVDSGTIDPAFRLLVKCLGQVPLGATSSTNQWFANDRPTLGEDLLRCGAGLAQHEGV